MKSTWITKTSFLSALIASSISFSTLAEDLPGTGITVQPLQSTIAEEAFQTIIVNKAMKALGYTVIPTKRVDYNIAYTSVANGDATYFAAYWTPSHTNKYQNAGGDAVFFTGGDYIANAAQGYMIDKKTAEKYNITNIAQFTDPEIAKLFDVDNDGKADLIGCNPGWGCSDDLDYQLKKYNLTDTVTEVSGNYSAIIIDTITRYNNGDSIFYYTWTPYWVSSVLIPGKDVIWLEVPYTALFGEYNKNADTSLPNGKNYGFPLNNMKVLANKKFTEKNPAAAKLFAIIKLNIQDINAQNMMMRKGQNTTKDINTHAEGWIKAHQKQFDAWIAEAKKAAK